MPTVSAGLGTRAVSACALAVALVLTAPAAAAQQAAPLLAAPVAERGVTVTMSGYLRPSDEGEIALPSHLLEQLAAEPALIALDTAPVDGRVVVQVRLAFRGLPEFHRWSEEGSGAELLRAIARDHDRRKRGNLPDGAAGTRPVKGTARLRRWMVAAAGTAGVVIVVRTFVVQVYGISTPSMMPTLLPGDFVVRNGKVLEEPFVSRAAREDEPLPFDGPYGVAWHRSALPSTVDTKTYRPSRDTWGPLVVPPDHYLLLGDDRDGSRDSRVTGFVHRARIRGTVVGIYFSMEPGPSPFPRAVRAARWARVGRRVR